MNEHVEADNHGWHKKREPQPCTPKRAKGPITAPKILPLALAAIGVLTSACGDDDDCPPKPLSELCGDCSKTREQIIESLCMMAGGPLDNDTWREGQNSCGGTNLEVNATFVGVTYSFDRDGKLVGGIRTSDTEDDSMKCASFDTFYGKICSGSDYVEHSCADTP